MKSGLYLLRKINGVKLYKINWIERYNLEYGNK